ncbi:hypothetical protein DES36_11084 [Alkalibaculum bacchi]|uniref:Polymerase/histidinol phosphatase N-terminal domain-containing protein n=1 Tax=Alkalibaculum bacchi TaxID=645887 RepID=A0A366I527_9FIRM|nr:PHP domain-containing protein [Alkalibaculum bacchi]RBP63341.1 hypothetical protein DES36_11084 [Alkalibaculum bacchi]
MNKIDLHMHSIYSIDGEYTPKQLVKMCAQKSVKVMALTDHNSIKGVAEAKEYAEESGIHCIPAIELDCTFESATLHVLGYGINTEFEDFNQIEQDILKQEQVASIKRIELVKKLGIVFDTNEAIKLSKDGYISGEMIAEVALKHEENRNHLLMTPYYEGGDRCDNPYVNFYWDICSQGKAAYVPVEYITLKKAIETIKAAGGVSVLAHPGNNVREDKEFLERIIKEGIDGIEVYSSYHTPNQMAFYKEQVEKYSLLQTVGSDFHGKTKPAIEIDSVQCNSQGEKIYHSLMEKINSI